MYQVLHLVPGTICHMYYSMRLDDDTNETNDMEDTIDFEDTDDMYDTYIIHQALPTSITVT